jgi:hypothetical protein
MIHLLVNQIWLHNQSRFRILFIHNDIEEIIWIKVDDQNSLPESSDLEEFIMLQKKGAVTLDETIEELGDPSLLKKKSLVKWKIHCEIIESIQSEEPQIYLNQYFNNRCSEIAKSLEVSRMLPRRVILRYWKGGKNKLALLPKLNNSGGKGKERKISSKKRGRPNSFTKNDTNVDEKLEKILQQGFKIYYLEGGQASLETAFESFLEAKYYNEVKKGQQELIPSITQFRYWGEKKYPANERKRKKAGLKNFNKDFRNQTESSLINVTGPGSLFQIDSTNSDIELVSSNDRSVPIGSPTLYFVTDVFSRMIVGVLVTLDQPSYYTAARAIYNTIIDKEQFFNEARLTEISEFRITNEDWPCNYIPDAIVADRAELIGHQSNNLINDLGITLENTASYRADLKGLVESHFDALHKRIRGIQKNIGMKSTDHKQRGVRDARKDAILTMKEYYIAVLSEVLVYNNSKVLESYPLDAQIVNDIPSVTPIKLWKWGIQNASGQLRLNNIPGLKQRLLPRKGGKINKKGLRFNKLWYNFSDNKKLLERQILLQNRTEIVEVLYDPFDLRKTYIYYDSEMIECELSKSRNPIAIELNEWEYLTHLTLVKRAQYEDKEEHQLRAIDSIKLMKEIFSSAKKQKAKKKTNALKPTKIRENKKIEAALNRRMSAENPSDDKSKKEVKVIKMEPKSDKETKKNKNQDMNFFRNLMTDEENS